MYPPTLGCTRGFTLLLCIRVRVHQALFAARVLIFILTSILFLTAALVLLLLLLRDECLTSACSVAFPFSLLLLPSPNPSSPHSDGLQPHSRTQALRGAALRPIRPCTRPLPAEQLDAVIQPAPHLHFLKPSPKKTWAPRSTAAGEQPGPPLLQHRVLSSTTPPSPLAGPGWAWPLSHVGR